MLSEGMFIADRYEILEKIGSGGMSEVYKAMDHKLNRYVAMKVLKSEFSEDKTFVTKFRAEAQSAAGLMHANIVNVYDVGEEDGLHYIVMELVEGITLKKYIERKGRLGSREAVSIAIQVAQGIEAAHRHHIVHRDIKPQNIIISKEGKVKVTDFGIARAASSNTINSAVMGSVHYISPEQARGGYSDEKSDIYSFGVTLFEMLTGKVPFEGDSTVAVALCHIQNEMVSPKTLVPDLPVSVEKIVLKCTQKKTERRYQNVSDLIADLKRSLVTPDEDFVVIATMVPADGATRIIGDDELVEISQRNADKSAHVVNLDMDFENDLTEENSYPEEAAEEEDDDDSSEDPDEYDEDEDEDDGTRNKKLDLIITIAGIVVAIGILIATIMLINKMTGGNSLFGNKEETTTPKVVTNETESGALVPKVIGMTEDEAKKALNAAGLGVKVVEQYSTYEEGTVFDQSEESGDRVAENTTVLIYVSLGVEKVTLEDLVGMAQEEAESYLKEIGAVIEYAYEETEDDELIGTVAKTIPISGAQVASGDTVTVTVYTGVSVKNVTVPNVVGKTESAARKAIEEAGLVVGDVVSAYDSEVAAGLVISQSGATAESDAPEGSVVNFVLSLGKEPETEAMATVPDVVGKTEADAKSAILAANLKVGTVTTDYSSTVAKGNVISQSVSSGKSVSQNTEVNLVISEGAKPEETTEAVPKVSQDIDSSVITDVLTSWDKTQAMKLVYELVYTNTSGKEATLKLATVTYENWDAAKAKFPVKLEEEVDGAAKGSATIKITISYNGTANGETTAEGTEEIAYASTATATVKTTIE